MRSSEVPKDILVNPTPDQLRLAIHAAITHWDTPRHPGLTLASPSLDELAGPEGYREWSALRLVRTSKTLTRALTVAWWTSGDGTRYVRITNYATFLYHSISSWQDYPFTPWSAVFPLRARQLRDRRKARLQRLLTRRLQTAASPTLMFPRRPPHMTQHLPEEFASGSLVAASPDGLLIVDTPRDPKHGALIFADALGTFRLRTLPLRYVHSARKFYQKLGAGPARIQAALTWVLAQALTDK
ncbi:MAG: hypothetical protein ACHQ7N_18110 [Candidatus Methylomirabilales bacterium]